MKPTALKIIEGTARKNPQRINRNEPEVQLGSTAPPFLPEIGPAREAWDRHYPMLMKMRVLTQVDADALALGCIALEEFLIARADDESWRKADSAWKRYAACLGWFGMNPSARAKVQAAPVGSSDPVEQWATR